ncbi:MAG: hypothetical protein JWQ01_65 [Massilia sp.]|nr:hypothetical protein [Massilia sp.]
MGFDLGNLLQQYASQHPATPEQAENDFDQVAQAAPRADLAQGVTQAFRSDQTPPFSQMVGQLFNQGDSGQRAGMLNQLLGGLGPGILSSIAGGALGNMFGGGSNNQAQIPQISPEQASQMTPEQVQQIAEKAEQHNPGVMDRMGEFYAQHPQLVKGLGGAALALVLGHMAQGMRR